MKSFELQFRFRDRSDTTVESTVKAEASSLPGAVGKAVREFVKGLDRKAALRHEQERTRNRRQIPRSSSRNTGRRIRKGRVKLVGAGVHSPARLGLGCSSPVSDAADLQP